MQRVKIGPRKVQAALAGALAIAGAAIAWALGGTDALVATSSAVLFAAMGLVAFMIVQSHRRLRHLLRAHQRELSLRVTALESQMQRTHTPNAHAEPLLRAIHARFQRAEAAQERFAKAAEADTFNTFRQFEALIGLYLDTQAKVAFPPTRSWVASPDTLYYLHQLVRREEPELVVECGSGLSTVIIAYALRQNGKGRIVSLEHLEKYREQTRDLLARHGVSEWADVRLAPLQDIDVKGEPWPWYSVGALPEGEIDILFVDGPPGAVGPLSRFPALPLLADRLEEGAIVVLDDYERADETQLTDRWLELYPGVTSTIVPHEKGTAVLRWSRSTEPGAPSVTVEDQPPASS